MPGMGFKVGPSPAGAEGDCVAGGCVDESDGRAGV